MELELELVHSSDRIVNCNCTERNGQSESGKHDMKEMEWNQLNSICETDEGYRDVCNDRRIGCVLNCDDMSSARSIHWFCRLAVT